MRRGYSGGFQSSSTCGGDDKRIGWTEQGIATQMTGQFAERSTRHLATKYAERGAFSERTNEMAAIAHPVRVRVATARCRNNAEEWRRRKEINRRAREVIRAWLEKSDEVTARAAHTEDVVRQSEAGATEKSMATTWRTRGRKHRWWRLCVRSGGNNTRSRRTHGWQNNL